ncbi:MAG: rhomboid family intramembrane serine protease [Myxococcales bacterium]|nr:rhomboid family intramembrane serine protease [Myxococcales bacterium]
MLLPIGDTPNPRNFTPWVNWGLMGLNIAVYLFLTLPMSAEPVDLRDPAVQEVLRTGFHAASRWDLFTFVHGYKPGAPSFVDLMSAMFMHAGFLHLAGNMLFLWIYGDNVEHHLGRALYLVTYLLTGVAATLAFGLFAGPSLVPLVGASGAISGVLGCYFLLFPRNRIKVFVFLFPFIMNVFLVPARIVLAVFLVIDNLFPALLSSGSGGGGVAYGAHIGGFVAGLGIAWLGERVHWGRGLTAGATRPAPKRSGPRLTTVSDVESVLVRAVESGDRAEAVRQARLLHPSQVVALLGGRAVRLAEWLAEVGEPVLAMTLLRRALALPRGQVDQAQVLLTLGLVRLSQGQVTAAYQHLLSALDHDPDPATEERVHEALRRIGPLA